MALRAEASSGVVGRLTLKAVRGGNERHAPQGERHAYPLLICALTRFWLLERLAEELSLPSWATDSGGEKLMVSSAFKREQCNTSREWQGGDGKKKPKKTAVDAVGVPCQRDGSVHHSPKDVVGWMAARGMRGLASRGGGASSSSSDAGCMAKDAARDNDVTGGEEAEEHEVLRALHHAPKKCVH